MNPRQAERRHAMRATLSNPLLWVRHGAACSGFLVDYATTRLRRSIARDVHAVGKSRPPWLPPSQASSSPLQDAPLRWPEYALDERSEWPRSLTSTSALSNDDLETYYAASRWTDCLLAIGGTDAEVAAAVQHARAWWRQTPARSNPAWEPYSAAERVANLAVLLAARPGARDHFDPAELRAFLQESQLWIAAHLEYYGPRRTNNHILNDARALVISGAVLADTAVADQGLRLFAQMGRELFQAGGFLRERSAHYHVVVTNWLLDAVHFGRLAGESLSIDRAPLGDLEELASRALRATAVLGSWATGDSLIGDISPDCPPALSHARLRRLYGASIPTLAPGNGRQHVDDWVFLHAPNQSVAACTIDGRFPLDRPTHGHSDLTHLNWRWRGASVLVDAGRARYTKDPISLAQSGAEGHNVLLVNGLGPLAESLVDGGVWHLRPYADATVSTRVDDDSLTVTHDGFRRMGPATRAKRIVRFAADGLVIIDEIEGRVRRRSIASGIFRHSSGPSARPQWRSRTSWPRR